VNGRVIVYFQLKVVETYYCLLVCGELRIGFLVNARGVTVGRFFVLKCDVKDTQNDTEEQFNQLSLEERGKFDEETLVNFNSLRRHVMAGSKGTQFHNEYIVVRSSAPCSYNSCYMQGHLSVSRSLCAPSNLGHCLSPEGHGKYSFTSTLFLPPVRCVVSP